MISSKRQKLSVNLGFDTDFWKSHIYFLGFYISNINFAGSSGSYVDYLTECIFCIQIIIYIPIKKASAIAVFSLFQKYLLEIEKKLKDLKPVSETQGKGKRILIQDIEDSDGDEKRGENTEEHERSGRDKSNVMSFPI